MVQITKSGSSVGEKRFINPCLCSDRVLKSANHITEPEDRFDKASNFSRLLVKTKILLSFTSFCFLVLLLQSFIEGYQIRSGSEITSGIRSFCSCSWWEGYLGALGM